MRYATVDLFWRIIYFYNELPPSLAPHNTLYFVVWCCGGGKEMIGVVIGFVLHLV